MWVANEDRWGLVYRDLEDTADWEGPGWDPEGAQLAGDCLDLGLWDRLE
jgi:hypothetical protein